MSKKIQLLNEHLEVGRSTPVLFPLPPVGIPIDNRGVVVSEDEATHAHYATFVYSIHDGEFCLFEFNQMIYDGVIAYKARYNKMSKVEILLSREEDGCLRMTVGNNRIQKKIVSKESFDEFSKYYDKLFNRYLSKQGYRVSDFSEE